MALSILSLVVVISLVLFRLAEKDLSAKIESVSSEINIKSKFIRLWFAFFLGVFAGLMTIGHAVPIIKASGGFIWTIAITAITLMTFGSGIAGICVGWLADRYGCKRPILVILAINSFALFSLTMINKY